MLHERQRDFGDFSYSIIAFGVREWTLFSDFADFLVLSNIQLCQLKILHQYVLWCFSCDVFLIK